MINDLRLYHVVLFGKVSIVPVSPGCFVGTVEIGHAGRLLVELELVHDFRAFEGFQRHSVDIEGR